MKEKIAVIMQEIVDDVFNECCCNDRVAGIVLEEVMGNLRFSEIVRWAWAHLSIRRDSTLEGEDFIKAVVNDAVDKFDELLLEEVDCRMSDLKQKVSTSSIDLTRYSTVKLRIQELALEDYSNGKAKEKEEAVSEK